MFTLLGGAELADEVLHPLTDVAFITSTGIIPTFSSASGPTAAKNLLDS